MGNFTSVANFHPYPGVLEVIAELRQAGILPIILTSQTRIATGDMNEAELKQSLLAMGFADVYICPHLETANCDCRKPKTGLINKAQVKYSFQNDETVIIGDSYQTDVQCAQNAGLLGIHVSTGRGMRDPLFTKFKFVEVENLIEACSWILKSQ